LLQIKNSVWLRYKLACFGVLDFDSPHLTREPRWLEHFDSNPVSPDFLAKMLGVTTQVFLIHNFILQFLDHLCSVWYLSWLHAYLHCRWPMSDAHLILAFFSFCTMSIMAEDNLFSFHSLCFIFRFFSLFFYIREWEEWRLFLNVKDWKYTNILRHWSFYILSE
jgi:hypothetical protein